MNDEQQTQQADDPSGPGWRDVGPDEILQTDDRFWVVDHWEATQNVGTKSFRYGTGYRRRIVQQQQQPSESEPVIDHRQCVKALQQIAQLADTGSKAHKERFCPNGEGDGIANGWRVAEAMREVANNVVGGVSLQQQPSDSEPETMQQLREQVRDLTQELKDKSDTYQICLRNHYKAGQRSAIDKLQAWLRPVLEVVADHPDDTSILAASVLEFLPQIALRLIEE
jgi:hypothetical protein